ncbi:MAG: hypothetical protein V4669_01755 [Pseudomonadota bacterium]
MAQMNLVRPAWGAVVLLVAMLGGCATREPAPAASATPSQDAAPAYRCENGLRFTLRAAADSAVVDMGARGSESLLRDAGGITPDQTVYSNARIRAEFGLGAQGREAVLRYIASPLVVKCARD